MRTSPPRALTESRSSREPGTRSMSPKEQNVTSGRPATAIARSIISRGVTQTGQPGPWTRRTLSGSSSSRPNLRMEWVCPPQTSINVQGRVAVPRIRRESASTATGSRYSSTWRIAQLLGHGQLPDLLQGLERLPGGLLVDARDREAHVDQHVVPGPRLGQVGQT